MIAVLAYNDDLKAWLIQTKDATYFTRTIPDGALDTRRTYRALLIGGAK